MRSHINDAIFLQNNIRLKVDLLFFCFFYISIEVLLQNSYHGHKHFKGLLCG